MKKSTDNQKNNLRDTKLKRLALIIMMLTMLAAVIVMSTVISNADSYYTIRIDYVFAADGSPAHDPYIAAYPAGESMSVTVTNPVIDGYVAMDGTGNDAHTALTTEFQSDALDRNYSATVYYLAGQVPYEVWYYKQNIYDDLYKRDKNVPSSFSYRYGETGTNPTVLETDTPPGYEGFENLFHEPEAIAADGSTVFRVYFNRNYYSIDFDLGDGGYGVDPIYAKYQTEYHIGEPKRLGYTFCGWVETNADGTAYYDENGNEITCVVDGETLTGPEMTDEQLVDGNYPFGITDGTVPARNQYFKAIWAPSTTHFNVVYWIENANSTLDENSFDGLSDAEAQALISANYSALAVRDVYNIYDASSNSLVPVTPGTVITPDTRIRTRQQRYDKNGSKAAKDYTQLKDFFSFNLNYADSTKTPVVDEEDGVVFMFDSKGNVIDFNTISKGTSKELTGAGDFFEMNSSENTDVPLLATDTEVTVRGDGTTHFNVFFKRKTFTLKFYYARQGYTNGVLDPNKISLTNSTKAFNNTTNEKEYLKTTSKNVLEAIAMGSWKPNLADTLPTVKDEYKQRVTEGYDDFTDSHYHGYYRYYYYQWQAKYNEPLNDKWLIDALNPVHRKNADAKEMCYPGSIATEYYNKYYQDRNSTGNYTVKGIYEKLDKGILFTDSARATMKQNKIDYTELHFLISWTNSSDNDTWNNSITRVLHFRYENYVELLPREVEIVENSGEQALLAEGNYTDVRTFTAKVNEDGTWVEKTRWYGLTTDHIYETIDSGNQYDSGKDKDMEARKNQTPTQMTGFELEPKDPASTTTYPLDQYNTEIDWSQDTQNYRRCIIKFFYHRIRYTLSYYNGNGIDEAHTNTAVMYKAPMNSTYSISEGEHLAGQYRYYWSNPTYYIESLNSYYNFAGWYNDPRFESPFDLDTQTMPADDYILYAKWVPRTIEVSFYQTYDHYYDDNAIPLGLDEETEDYFDSVKVDYGDYVDLKYIPTNSHSSYRPYLEPPSVGASFAGWYYLDNGVPVRFEPEKKIVTAMNKESSAAHGARLRLFAEWVSKNVAKYRIKYVEKDHPEIEVAPPSTGRAYVYKTKTFNAKTGSELNEAHAWSDNDEDTNWWPIANSHSILIKDQEQGKEYAPNEWSFEYVKKGSVAYKVRYLLAGTTYELAPSETGTSTHASIKVDSKYIPGYVVDASVKTAVLAASDKPNQEDWEADELEMNVITFYYTENKTEYLYDVEYYLQNLEDDNYPDEPYQTESLTAAIVEGGDTLVTVADLYGRHIPTIFAANGYQSEPSLTAKRVGSGEPMLVGNAETVAIEGDPKTTFRLYFSRKTYPYSYQYVDMTAEKAYNDAEDKTGKWNGVISAVNKPAVKVDSEIDLTSTVAENLTYNGTPYTRIGAGTPVTLTIVANDDNDPNLNLVKVYYKKDTERELEYKMVCVNSNSETDYSPTIGDPSGDPLFGGLSMAMQTVENYDAIQPVEFYNFNEAVDPDIPETVDIKERYIHKHYYKFLGWYSQPERGEDDANRITTNTTITKDDLNTYYSLNNDLPSRSQTTYYALVEQEMVKLDIEFVYIDSDSLPKTDDSDPSVPTYDRDNAARAIIMEAIQNGQSNTDGSFIGAYVRFTSPSTYENHGEIPRHKTDGYKLMVENQDGRVYRYEIKEWWKRHDTPEDMNTADYGKLERMNNWNNGDWGAAGLDSQVFRNQNNHLLAVFLRRPITELPYTINYQFKDRYGNLRTYVKKGTLNLEDPKDAAKYNSTDTGAFELTDEFILENAPYESNYAKRLVWSDAEDLITKTSVKGDSTAEDEAEQKDRIITYVTSVQTDQEVHAVYSTTPGGKTATVSGKIGDNYKLNEGMLAIEAPDTYDGKSFAYWEVRKSANTSDPVIAKSYSPLFDLCLMDNYWLTPVYEGAARGSGTLTATLDPLAFAEDGKYWFAWTWTDSKLSGEWVSPCDGMTFKGLHENVVFVRSTLATHPSTGLGLSSMPVGITGYTEDLTVTENDGKTYALTSIGSVIPKFAGEWREPAAATPTVTLTHIGNTRNTWTDNKDEVPANGSTDILYTDFEIAYENGAEEIFNAAEGTYSTGVVFELCATVPASATINPAGSYVYSDPDALKAAIKNPTGSYQYDPDKKPGKTRTYQISEIPQSALTNRDRVQYGKGYKNTFKYVNETKTYINANYLLKATAYLKKGDDVWLSNSVYLCLKDVGLYESALDSMIERTNSN